MGLPLFSNALNSNGKAWGWGDNFYGQVGDNTTTTRCSPVSVAGTAKTFCQISAGQQGSFALIDYRGKAWAWGYNNPVQLGDNTILSKNTPVSIGGTAKTFCKISAGGAHSLAIDYQGKVWAWGSNGYGRLGDNSITNRCTPVSVAGGVQKHFVKLQVDLLFHLE